MSNHLAIATVTAALQRILQGIAQTDVAGARVTTVRPDNSGTGTPETGVNIYLYQVTPVNWRNSDLPTRRSTGQVIKRPQIALNLNYLITFYGNELDLEPQRLLGAVVRALHAQPILSPDAIRDTLADPMFSYLSASDLGDEIETIKLQLMPLSTEDLSKIWSVFFQTPYTLSVSYQIGVVLLESDIIPQRALPVRETQFRIAPYQIALEQVYNLDEVPGYGGRMVNPRPILPSSTVAIRGQKIANPNSFVRLGKAEILPEEGEDDRLMKISLAKAPRHELRAGPQGLQVIHRPGTSPNGSSRYGAESNVVAFVLHPEIKAVEAHHVRGEEDDPRSAILNVRTDPYIGREQRVSLTLNERSIENPQSYTFVVRSQRDTNLLEVPISGVKPGNYLVRLQVDGVESLLTVDLTPGSPTYDQYVAPQVRIP